MAADRPMKISTPTWRRLKRLSRIRQQNMGVVVDIAARMLEQQMRRERGEDEPVIPQLDAGEVGEPSED